MHAVLNQYISIYFQQNNKKIKGTWKNLENDQVKRYLNFLRIQIGPWGLHRVHVNGKTVSTNDHIQNKQIHEVSVIYFSYATVAMTKPGGMQGYIGYCKQILPTTDKLQGCLSHGQID